MKKIKYILIPFLSLVIFASCEDAIDIKQPGRLYAEQTFQTVGDLEKGVNACYVPFASSPTAEIQFASVFTDECSIGTANTGQGLIDDATYLFTLNPNSGAPNSVWQSNYTLINYANRVIEAAKTIKPSADEQGLYDNAIAQALIFRAWGHFKLLSYFATDMTAAHDADPGVIKMDFVPKITDKLDRSSVGDIYKFIKSDLDEAEVLLNGDLLENPAPRVFLSKDFVTAFRARLAAYRGDYDGAATYVNALKSAYPLTPFASYKQIWADSPTFPGNEIIFKIERLSGQGTPGTIWAFNSSGVNGQPIYLMGTDLFNLLNNTKDARSATFIDPTSTSTVHCIGKYPSPSASEGGSWTNDVKVFRMSEMYFIMAENYASKNDFENVQKELQAVNKARFSGVAPTIPTPNSAKEAWSQILLQRRIELCFEGHRYLDMKRLGAKAGVNITRNLNDCSKYDACSLSTTNPSDAYKFTFPIPNNELKANPVISRNQNPGY